MRAPGNGTMVNVMLRPGFFVAGMPFNEVMTFVDNEYQIFGMFSQNELHQVEPGNEAEITLDTHPGHIIKAHVDSVIWAQSQGQLDASGNLPQTTFTPPPGQFPVKLVVAEHDNPLFLAAVPAARRDLHGAPRDHSHHSKGAATGVVVSRLHHHQAPYQSPTEGSARCLVSVLTARRRFRPSLRRSRPVWWRRGGRLCAEEAA